MNTDYHFHCLPSIDDGPDNCEESLAMINMLRKQGIKRAVATPHYYHHREKSVDDFIRKRKDSYEKIAGLTDFPIILGAEVYIEHGISKVKGIEKLASEGTELLLVEMPHTVFHEWYLEEIYNLKMKYNLKIILAHIDRYINQYSRHQVERILETDSIMQFNIDSLKRIKERAFFYKLCKQNYTIVFGSDSHDSHYRKPEWNSRLFAPPEKAMNISNSVFDKYSV